MKKAKKKPAAKIKLKQGRFAAILTLRITPDEIEKYNKLLQFFNKKNYSEAVTMAADSVVKLDGDLKETKKQLQEIGDKYLLAMRKMSLLVQSQLGVSEFIKKNAKDIKEPETCPYCDLNLDSEGRCRECD